MCMVHVCVCGVGGGGGGGGGGRFTCTCISILYIYIQVVFHQVLVNNYLLAYYNQTYNTYLQVKGVCIPYHCEEFTLSMLDPKQNLCLECIQLNCDNTGSH